MKKQITLNDSNCKKVGTLSELWGLDFQGTIEKLIDDALAREYPEEAKRRAKEVK